LFMYRQALETAHQLGEICLVPKIKVIGLGGAGSNAVDRMITVGIPGVEYVAANTDRQALTMSEAQVKVQLGPRMTRGLGAGGKAEIGCEAARESEAALRDALAGADLVFVAAGMGGGTGTGSAPVAARLARELGALTVAVVTTPFSFEGTHRARTAQAGVQALSKQVHTLILVHNDQLLKVAPRNLQLEVAFRVADEVLRQGIQGIVELVSQTGLVNLDFASVSSVIQQGGNALMAIGRGEHVQQAARAALNHPLLENDMIQRASAVLVQVTGGSDMGLADINQAMTEIIAAANPAADVLFGATEDPEMDERAQVILIATGIHETPREPIVVQSLFGVPLPSKQEQQSDPQAADDEPQDPGSPLDVPAFLRRRDLFDSQPDEDTPWASG
jgi:cell division protein FtsZ